MNLVEYTPSNYMAVQQSRRRKHVNYTKGVVKILLLFDITIILLEGVAVLLRWKTVDPLPVFLQPYSDTLLFISPYLRYIDAVIILVVGYFIVGEVGRTVYSYMRGFADHSSAATVQNMAKIVGFGVLLAVLASVFSVDPAAGLTLGGFGGLVVGFATQTFLANTIAGKFVLMTRLLHIRQRHNHRRQTSAVKEIRVMHILLETLNGSKDILIPNSLVLNQMILKNLPGEKMAPIHTVITLDQPEPKSR